MPKIWVGRTTLNGEKKEVGLMRFAGGLALVRISGVSVIAWCPQGEVDCISFADKLSNRTYFFPVTRTGIQLKSGIRPPSLQIGHICSSGFL